MTNSNRMYGLDALRGVAMTLGIFLHSSIAYKRGYHYGEWVFDKEFTSFFFDWLYLWINSFRMQTFFLLAGFFAQVLINKIGLLEFSKNRLKRIGVPLVLSYFTILPFTLAPYLLFVEFTGANPAQQLFEFYIRFFTLRAHFGFMHLWFLQHLLVFYGIFVSIVFLMKKSGFLQSGKLLSSQPVIRFSTYFIFSTLLLGVLSQLFNTILPSIWVGFVIPIPQFLYYLFFFSLGWFLERKRELFNSFNNSYKSFLLIGTLLNFAVLFFINSEDMLNSATYWVVGLKFLFSLQTMLLTIGVIGFFNSTFKKANHFWNYIADSAYWVYLIHMPIVMITQMLLLDSVIPGILKFPIVLVSTIIISFGTYQLFVRYTWIGNLLNGLRLRNNLK